MTLVFAKVVKSLCLVADAASELNGLVADTITAASVSRAIKTSGTVLEHSLAKLLQLALGKRTLHTDLFAELALHPFFIKKIGSLS